MQEVTLATNTKKNLRLSCFDCCLLAQAILAWSTLGPCLPLMESLCLCCQVLPVTR